MSKRYGRRLLLAIIVFVLICAYLWKRYVLEKTSMPNFNIMRTKNDEWFPLVIDKCTAGMQNTSAPCLVETAKGSNLAYAQEVVYAPFMLATPGFVTESDKEHWLKHAASIDRFRLSNDKSWALYPTQYGQNLIFKDAVYSGNPVPDTWGESSCIAPKVSHSQFFKSSLNHRMHTNKVDDIVILATSPDSWSMQHFQDRVLPLFIHAHLSIPSSSDPVLLTGRYPERSILSLYEKFGIDKHLHYTSGSYPIQAKYLIFPCRMPLIHPWTHMEVSKKLGWLSYDLPIEKRLDVLWLGRRPTDKHQLNKGRYLSNEDEFLVALRSLLLKRNLGERLVVFDPDIHGVIGKSADYMAQNVRAVLGVHGAKFYNARYCAKGTFVFEIYQKVDSYCPCFWEQSRLSYQNHYIHFAEPEDEANVNFSNMIIKDIPTSIRIIDQHLGKPYNPDDALRHSSYWEIS